ncbi:hypothetical protein ANO14919_026090 [Xylariales sp. No.14919]|nr:hypothetical protein ANO14919_026090 [Xylariales sp. No.14919]
MRLINSKTLQLHEFEQSSPGIPRYAILSHTWGDDEVTFHDMTSKHPAALARKKGYAKIWQTCRLAQRHNLEYVWIDTCCIDKSSSAELSESINSMFKWYANAAICYVFLFDFVAGERELRACRWWTRGWTLQELLAPGILAFYDAGWTAVGTKQSLTREISDITGIGQEILLRPSQIFLCSVSQRMSWAAFRETTRIEDKAYCLLGIFGIHMPLLYGEGLMAFRRLQEEIIKRSADLTIFFWGVTPSDDGKPQYLSLFAESPDAFSSDAPSKPATLGFPEFVLTNKGVFFSNVSNLAVINDLERGDVIYGFLLGWDDQQPLIIILRKVGPGIFCRDGRGLVRGEARRLSTTNSFYVLADPELIVEDAIMQSRQHAPHLRHNEQFQLQSVVPNHIWDVADHVFLYTPQSTFQNVPSPNHRVTLDHELATAAMAFDVQFGSVTVSLVIFFDEGKFKMFERDSYTEQCELLFRKQNLEKSIPLSDFRKLMPCFDSLQDGVDIKLSDDRHVHITVELLSGTLEVMSKEVDVWDIVFKVEMK